MVPGNLCSLLLSLKVEERNDERREMTCLV